VTSPLHITIAICTYRRPLILRRVLERWRELYALEEAVDLLIINNGNDQPTEDLAAEFAAHLPITHIYEQRPGVSNARNRAIAEATGEVLAYLDDDCLPDASWLPTIREYFQRDENRKIGMLGGQINLHWDMEPPAWYHRKFISSFSGMDYPAGDYQPQSSDQWLGEGNCAFWRERLTEMGGFNPKLGRVKKLLISNEGNELRERLESAGWETWYSSRMPVAHIVFEERLKSSNWILKRNFWGGVSQQIQQVQQGAPPPTLRDYWRMASAIITGGDLRYMRRAEHNDHATLERAMQAQYRLGVLYAMIRHRWP